MKRFLLYQNLFLFLLLFFLVMQLVTTKKIATTAQSLITDCASSEECNLKFFTHKILIQNALNESLENMKVYSSRYKIIESEEDYLYIYDNQYATYIEIEKNNGCETIKVEKEDKKQYFFKNLCKNLNFFEIKSYNE
jgi:hypothetical protein